MQVQFKSMSEEKYQTNIILNYIFKFLAIILSLISVRVNLKFLGNNLYGLWVTIASIISWMNSGDFGISNGLRNELAKAYGLNDRELQYKLIATAICTLSKVSVLLFFLILVLCEIFFRTYILDATLRIPMYITAFFFCLNLCFGISQSIAYSYQKSWLTSFTSCNMTFISIIVILCMSLCNIPSNLTIFAVVNGLCTLIPNLILMLIINQKEIPFIQKGIKSNFDISVRNSIVNVGIMFFGLQICSVILSSTDNIIINYLFNSEMVTKYSIITKVYQAGTNLFSIFLIALWSAVTYRIAQKDYRWISDKIKELHKMWILFTLGIVLVSLLFNLIVRVWLGKNTYVYSPQMILLFGVYCSLTAFSAIYVNIVNGMGMVKLQLILAILEATINIPLSIFFAKYCGMGILGVKFATFLCAVLSAVAMPIQVYYILQKKTKIII